MDRIVVIAAIIAVVVVVGTGIMLVSNQPQPKQKPSIVPSVSQEEPKSQREPNTPKTTTEPRPEYKNATYGVMPQEVKGDCKLYKHVAKEEYKCFGTAGNYSTMVTNEYRLAQSDKYFCKPTIYGCRLYEKVYIQPF